MQHAFNVFVDSGAVLKRCLAQLLVGASTLTATVVILARVASLWTVGAP